MKQTSFSRVILLTIVGALMVAGGFFAAKGGLPGVRQKAEQPILAKWDGSGSPDRGVSIIWTAQGEEKSGHYEVVRTDIGKTGDETLLATVEPGTRIDRSGYYRFQDVNPSCSTCCYEVRYVTGSRTRIVSSVALAEKNG